MANICQQAVTSISKVSISDVLFTNINHFESRNFDKQHFLRSPNTLPHTLLKTLPFRRLLFNFQTYFQKFGLFRTQNKQVTATMFQKGPF